jgi:hypothetical protein
MSNKPKKVAFNLKPQGINGSFAKPLLAYPSTGAANVPLDATVLPPFGTFVAEVN